MISEWLAPTAAGASAAFVLAHPDDEYFCLPLIAAEVAGGRAVSIAYLTDGGPDATIREQESLRVLAGAGVEPGRVTFAGREHGWRDGALHLQISPARDWLATWLASSAGCARIYVTAYEGGHHDHDCCFGALASLQRDDRTGGARCLQFPLYTGRALPGALFKCMSAIPENGAHSSLRFSTRAAAHYWRMAAAYPSQWKSFIALGPASMPAYLGRRSIEVQAVNAARIQAAPHAGLPYFERRFRVPGQTVLEALRRL